MSESVTKALCALETSRPYAAATRHPFLTAAGTQTLPPSRLALWLAQDRIYAAHAYPSFVGRLIASIPWSKHPTDSSEEARNERTLKTLVYALQNVVREVGFFDALGGRWGFQVTQWKERKATRDYTAEMGSVAARGDVFEGLVFLWAMEKVYLDAWTYVRSTFEETMGKGVAEVSDSAIASLAANWTSPEFIAFVDDLAGLVDSFGVARGSARWARAESLWGRVVELEAEFWPEEGDELAASSPV
ncbi:hypothetical protein OF83DRAFT_1146899 [Amylostereum chailletii]|nr:hypothetical protein OF83DRAFT_1146899 [Amylostereum chailletii]